MTVKVKLNFWEWRRLQKYRPELFGSRISRHRNNGYILIKRAYHPFANRRGYVKEHRFVWEEYHKACLLPWADVHHLDSCKENNSISNLEAMMHRQHTRLECMKLKPWRGRMKQKAKEQGPIRQLITNCKKNNSRDTSRDRDTSL